MSPALRRRWIIALAVLAAAALLVLALRQLAAHTMRERVVESLGPRATLDAVTLGWGGIELHGLRIAAEPGSGWPAEDELRAERVWVRPALRSLFGGDWRVEAVRVENPYVSMLRTPEGRLRLLPALVEQREAAKAEDAQRERRPVHVGRVQVTGGTVDFHDASFKGRPHRLRVEGLAGSVGPLVMPALDAPIAIDLAGRLKGPDRDGQVQLKGDLTPATRDAQLAAQLRGVDIVLLQPYLLRAADTRVKAGILDLQLDATVERQRLRAPGQITLTGLELGGGSGVLGAFAGVPRQAVLAALERDGKLRIGFTLEGRLDDPKFSVNDNLAMRVSAGLAEGLGVSVGGVVEGAGAVVRELLGR